MAFREMRKKERKIGEDETDEILRNGEYGVLATTGENMYPYAVPLSYVYCDNCIYFHCAGDGHKLDNIEKDNRISFCVVTGTEVLRDKFSTKYKSAIIFGKAEKVNGDAKKEVLMKLLGKYSPDFMEKGRAYIEKAVDKTTIIKITIEHKSGKARKD